jgi:hypothetical protein
LPVTSVPSRTRVVASAIAARIVQASKMSPLRSRPIGLRWSNTQQESKPASSTSRQSRRYSSIVKCCCDAFHPIRISVSVTDRQ